MARGNPAIRSKAPRRSWVVCCSPEVAAPRGWGPSSVVVRVEGREAAQREVVGEPLHLDGDCGDGVLRDLHAVATERLADPREADNHQDSPSRRIRASSSSLYLVKERSAARTKSSSSRKWNSGASIKARRRASTAGGTGTGR